MRLPEHHNASDNKPPVRSRDYSFFYFQHEGESGRSYLRFTRLGVTLILLIIVVPLILILIFFLISSSRIENMNTNVHIPVQTSTPYSDNRPLIIQQPTSLPQPKIRQQPMNVPNPLTEPSGIHDNEYPTPNRSPSSQSSNRSPNFNHNGL
jgi:hypothetical protein